MIDTGYALGVIAAMALITFALRALPFIASRWLQRHDVVRRLGRFLPLAIMTLLLLHAIVGSAREHPGGPWRELLCAGLAALLQWRSRNPLLSIVTGTGLYVLLRNPSLF
ncbi:AzlD domain-containing protein [Malikia sp.]|uniref:branched-chain amino acid transporter permease n=1 Tax=Malikia sp. TaxID=2070706 RepID=UPI002630C34B|nr:AzlD domain-containing protein [Malikia sp.]MDD2728794.1 AzlD domain-containing protein [Malikia sp.]